MSEIHYTALAVESVCMSCGTQVARLSGVVWALRARYCEQCGYETRHLAPAPNCGQQMVLVEGCVVVES